MPGLSCVLVQGADFGESSLSLSFLTLISAKRVVEELAVETPEFMAEFTAVFSGDFSSVRPDSLLSKSPLFASEEAGLEG